MAQTFKNYKIKAVKVVFKPVFLSHLIFLHTGNWSYHFVHIYTEILYACIDKHLNTHTSLFIFLKQRAVRE